MLARKRVWQHLSLKVLHIDSFVHLTADREHLFIRAQFLPAPSTGTQEPCASDILSSPLSAWLPDFLHSKPACPFRSRRQFRRIVRQIPFIKQLFRAVEIPQGAGARSATAALGGECARENFPKGNSEFDILEFDISEAKQNLCPCVSESSRPWI